MVSTLPAPMPVENFPERSLADQMDIARDIGSDFRPSTFWLLCWCCHMSLVLPVLTGLWVLARARIFSLQDLGLVT